MRRQIDALGVWNACVLVAFVAAYQLAAPSHLRVGVYGCVSVRPGTTIRRSSGVPLGAENPCSNPSLLF